MPHAPFLVFASTHLENQFRRTIRGDTEVGGWLLCNQQAIPHWNYEQFRRYTGQSACFIRMFILAPNHSKTPKFSWCAWDWQKAHGLAHATAYALGYWELPFHTHPNRCLTPSSNDVAFYTRLSDDIICRFAIATSNPLRMTAYSINLQTCSSGTSDMKLAHAMSWAQIRKLGMLSSEHNER